ncbi:hypothetical protein NA56DRAFT_701483 [Hyaloscypha hepaticicola]|uniref:Uncharacterized protein n=1 Tax=Hyaloscypha hepaticicola TaxID=2082293 RepID=A0A2J6QAA9_9HELO|nr:hypothetical protein NA56DRAFT_701483 [Hyaloscypha hepaticicola]
MSDLPYSSQYLSDFGVAIESANKRHVLLFRYFIQLYLLRLQVSRYTPICHRITITATPCLEAGLSPKEFQRSVRPELTYLHSSAPSNSQITNIPVNIERGLDDEKWHDLFLHYSNTNFEPPQGRVNELDGRNPTPSRDLLQRWAYETSNINITFAERLEKSKWEAPRMQRL